MKHRIYLDTHFIDYLCNHKDYIWEGDLKSLKEARRGDKSCQINEYIALGSFPLLCWLNDWRILIGEFAFDELERIPDLHRREALFNYAEKLNNLRFLGLEDLEDEATPQEEQTAYLTTLYVRAINSLPTKDRLLVEEAIWLACDIFLTTDEMILKQAHLVEKSVGLRIRKLSEFIEEEVNQGEVNWINDDITMFPDILFYTGMIPDKKNEMNDSEPSPRD